MAVNNKKHPRKITDELQDLAHIARILKSSCNMLCRAVDKLVLLDAEGRKSDEG